MKKMSLKFVLNVFAIAAIGFLASCAETEKTEEAPAAETEMPAPQVQEAPAPTPGNDSLSVPAPESTAPAIPATDAPVKTTTTTR
jgi:hypothetical protein